MFPLPFKKRIEQQCLINSEELFRALAEPAPVTIRINRIKWNGEPLNSEPVPWCRDGFYLNERPSFTFDPFFHSGCYYPQEASGMFLEEAIRQLESDRENIKVLDLCGAPGGKSTHLSSIISKKGFLVANEVIKSRVSILTENITKWGIPDVMVTRSDPSSIGRIRGFFDLVLVDAPCSGEGMFRDITVRSEWSEENATLSSDRQKRILMDIWPALKENGILIYSTCTFNPEENEKNIKWFTDRKDSETIRLNISEFKGITEIEHHGIYGYGFYPGRIKGEGFFISLLRKKEKQPDMNIRIRKDMYPKISREEMQIVSEFLDIPRDELIRNGDKIIALPCNYNDFQLISGMLNVMKAGTYICKVKVNSGTKNILPMHDLALSVSYKSGFFPVADLDIDQALSYLSRNQVESGNVQKGWNIVQYKGINLGFINNIGSRINNYYPMEWRIRQQINEKSEVDLIKWDKYL